MSLNLNDLQIECKNWCQHNFPNAKPYQPLLGVAEEVGELCHIHLKQEQGIRNAKFEDKEDAIGDIVIFLIDYCNRNGINLEKAIYTAWNTASKRDWIKYPLNGINK